MRPRARGKGRPPEQPSEGQERNRLRERPRARGKGRPLEQLSDGQEKARPRERPRARSKDGRVKPSEGQEKDGFR